MDHDDNNNTPPRVSRWADVFATGQAKREKKAAWILEDLSSPFCAQYWVNRNANPYQQSALTTRSSQAIPIRQRQQKGVKSLEHQPTISPPMEFSEDPGTIFTKSFREKKAQQPRIQNPFGSMLEDRSKSPAMSPADSRSPSTPFEQDVQTPVQDVISVRVVHSTPAIQTTISVPEGPDRTDSSAINSLHREIQRFQISPDDTMSSSTLENDRSVDRFRPASHRIRRPTRPAGLSPRVWHDDSTVVQARQEQDYMVQWPNAYPADTLRSLSAGSATPPLVNTYARATRNRDDDRFTSSNRSRTTSRYPDRHNPSNVFGRSSNQTSQGQLVRRQMNIDSGAKGNMSEVIPDDDFFSLENFRPSSMNQEQRGLIDAPRGSKYLGNQDSQSAAHQYDDCPDHLNHALWVMRIHRDAQLKEILDTVRTGGIFATHMSPAKNGHDSQAIKIVFMTHDAAAEYLRQIHTTGIYVRGKRVEGKWNRNGYIIPPQGQRTRVLHIRGPVHYMERHKWEAYMQMGLSIDLEEFRELPDPDPSKKTFEFRLGRVDGQAEAVFQMICKNLKMRRNVEVRYGPDPCDPNSGFR